MEGKAVQQKPLWPTTHDQNTDVLRPVTAQDEPTEYMAALNESDAPTSDTNDAVNNEPPLPPTEPGDEDGTSPGKPRIVRRVGIITGSILGFLALVYGADLLITQGDVPRGVTVAGVDVGGMTRTSAEQKLRQDIEPRLDQPVQINAGDVQESLQPAIAGLNLDWSSTLDRAGDQPLNPFTRISSFFSTRELGVVSDAEENKLNAAMDSLRDKVNRAPVEGTVAFNNGKAEAVNPRQGQELDSAGATGAILSNWASGKPVDLPVNITPVRSTPEAVNIALEQIGKPAMSGPVTIHGEDETDAKLDTQTIGSALTFEVGDNGVLNPKVDPAKIAEGVGPQLKATEKEGKDAEIVFSGGKPTVEPSVDGKKVNWEKSLVPVIDVLKSKDKRELTAIYDTQPAKVTTEQAEKLGINEVIGEFSTGGFAADSGTNIKVVAQKVDGAIVKPGETFSLNGFTGPRGTAQGYVEAGVIDHGAPGREVGGGISQFATTLYNAAYFAGMKDAGHKEHSYYISRYPAAREATVFQTANGSSVIDLKFTNDAKTGIAIQTIWTPSQITVKLWGTKRYTVESVTGNKTNFTEPQEKPGPAENCHASNGAQGFTVTDTRILRDATSGREVNRKNHTVRYNPQPKIVCPT